MREPVGDLYPDGGTSKGRKMIRRMIRRFQMEDRGASMVEYALLVTLIALVALVAVQLAGTTLSSTYGEIASGLVKAGG
jgi:pilus assembly protein Flp/PilA